MRSLSEWYRYLEEQMRRAQSSQRGSTPQEGSQDLPSAVGPSRPGEGSPAREPSKRGTSPPRKAGPRPSPDPRARLQVHLARQQPLPIDLGQDLQVRRKGGRRPLTETREEIIQRLLDPEVTLHEASAILNLSKATLRRYTDQGKLPCIRTAGGQRRFRLSDLLAFLEQKEAP
jgi:excisionase family DNA binding protein